jgi:hypothetical protein
MALVILLLVLFYMLQFLVLMEIIRIYHYAFSNKVIGNWFWENTNYYWCSKIIQTQFDNPIVVPAGVERILVTVSKFKICMIQQ